MKSKFLLVLLLFINCGVRLAAQGNLFSNPSFEDYTSPCPTSSPNGAFGQVTNWFPANEIPGFGAPHAELYCNGTPNYGNCLPGPQMASNGDAYIGFHTRNVGWQYNEAIYQILTAPLTPGQSYRVTFDLMNCQSGLFTNGQSDFCIYANSDTIIPACPSQNPNVVLLGCVPFDSISNIDWKSHEIDFIAPTGIISNVIAFSGAACFTTDIYYYLDNTSLSSTTFISDNFPVAFSIGPNPFSENLYIEIDNPGIYEIEILDQNGKRIYQGTVVGKIKKELSIDQKLSNGVYIARISNDNHTKFSKLIRLD